MDYTLSATNITDSGFTITVATDVSTTTKTLELSVSNQGASIYLESVTDPGMSQGSYILERQITGLTGSTDYTVTFQLGGMDMANPITVTTKATGYDTPKTATQEQWEDLADRVNVRPIISTVVSQPTAVAYVDTANIVNDAVTPAKLDMASLIDILYPVGCYFETSDTSFDPNVSWGGTWSQDSAGKVTVSKDSGTFATVGDTGGEETHTLVEAELPSVSGYFEIHGEGSGTEFHKIHGNATGTLKSNQYKSLGGTASTGANSYTNPGFAFGSGQAHNNLQPYVVVVRWHRTA